MRKNPDDKKEAVGPAPELGQVQKDVPLRERIKKIQDAAGINGRTDGFDQKAYSDWLNDE